MLPIHFYFDKRVDIRSLTTKQDSSRQEELEPDILAQSTGSGSSSRIKDRRSKEKVGAESVRSSAVQRRSHHIREELSFRQPVQEIASERSLTNTVRVSVHVDCPVVVDVIDDGLI